MSKDERILKKVAKLLKLYGVSDEEKEKFILDLQDKKYDDEEVEETKDNPEEKTENEEVEEKVEETGDEVVEKTEEEKVEEQPQLPTDPQEMEEVEEEKVEESQFDYKAKFEELQKANDGLSARIQALEDIVASLGVEKPQDQTIGATPSGNAVDESYNSAFDEINRKRVG